MDEKLLRKEVSEMLEKSGQFTPAQCNALARAILFGSRLYHKTAILEYAKEIHLSTSGQSQVDEEDTDK